MSITDTISQRLRNYRRQAGMSQGELAKIAELHPTYIGQVERGEKNLTLSSLEKIVQALGISFSELFAFIDAGDNGRSPAVQCYELVSSKPAAQQEAMYRILSEINKLACKD